MEKKKFEQYHDSVVYLENLASLSKGKSYMRDTKDPSIHLKRTRYFLNLLGNPEKGFKYIHITGTAGKGTVATMLHEVLYVAGKRVGLFTSPFVVTSIEKIKVGRMYIAPSEFAQIVNYLKPYIERAHAEGPYGRPSYFEIFLAIALIYFKKQRCEWVVLEVGAGGAYDATNIISRSEIAVITNIDYDHTRLLGKTLKSIATTKAGIIKRGTVLFTCEHRPALLRIFRAACRRKCVKMYHIAKQKNYEADNEALVTAVGKHLRIKETHIARGIQGANLPGRFELMQQKPLVILDGAHNRAKIRTTVYNIQKLKFKKLYVVLGMSVRKNIDAIVCQIIPMADGVFLTNFRASGMEYVPPSQLLKKSKKYLKSKAHSKVHSDSKSAFDAALRKTDKDDAILVTGSFYLVGELRKLWVSEEQILETRQNF